MLGEGGQQTPLVPSVYSEAFATLLSIPGVNAIEFPMVALDSWLTKKGITPERAADTAVDLKAQLKHDQKRGEWSYTTVGGQRRWYADVAATFQKWAQRPTMQATQPPRMDGHGWANAVPLPPEEEEK